VTTVGPHDDEAFEAMIERSSLGTSGARRLRSRASASDLAQVRKVRDQAEKDRRASAESTSRSEQSDHSKRDADLTRRYDPSSPPEVDKAGNSAPQPQSVRVEEPSAAASAQQVARYVVVAVDPQTGEVDAHGPFDGLTATLIADRLRRDFNRGGLDDVTVGVVHIGYKDETSAPAAAARSEHIELRPGNDHDQ
jgi:hypothetical protein